MSVSIAFEVNSSLAQRTPFNDTTSRFRTLNPGTMRVMVPSMKSRNSGSCASVSLASSVLTAMEVVVFALE